MIGYNVGLGSCGSTNSDSELVAAMNHGQMANGGNSNHNPSCGRRVSIKVSDIYACASINCLHVDIGS